MNAIQSLKTGRLRYSRKVPERASRCRPRTLTTWFDVGRAMPRRMKRTAILLSLAVVGCGHSIEYTPMNKSPHGMSRRAPESVEVFMTQRPARPAVEVGYFEIEQQSPASGGTPEMMSKLREEAAAVGCDALLVSEPHDRVQSYSGQHQGVVHTTGTGYGAQPASGTYQGTSSVSANRVRSHRAICLMFTDDATTAPASTVPAPAL